MTEREMLEYIERMRAEQHARAYFCQTCKNWQLRDSHPGRCPKAAYPQLDHSQSNRGGRTP